ncbi:MAG: WhiB family transcriptional regulator [Mycobacteriales bacterium]
MSLARTEATWRAGAACQGDSATLFFPPNTFETREARIAREQAARALCDVCAVRAPCLEYALFVQEPHGIWGGLTELERRRMLRRRPTG